MKKLAAISRKYYMVFLGFALFVIMCSHAQKSNAGVIANSTISFGRPDISPPWFQCYSRGPEPYCGKNILSSYVGQDMVQRVIGDVTFRDPWSVEARAGGTSSASFSYGLLDRTLHFVINNPFDFDVYFSNEGDYTFEFSRLSVTEPGEFGRITTEFSIGGVRSSVDSGVWECSTPEDCKRPPVYTPGSGTAYLHSGWVAPGGSFAFSLRGIVTAWAQVVEVPEPGTLGVLVFGLAGLGVAARRRSRV